MENKLTKFYLLLSLVIPSIFFAVGLMIIFHWDVFEFDPDEGINLMKAFLVNQDYQLYTEIWNDQPPLLTYILAEVFNIFSPKVELARLTILIFATFILWETWIFLYLFIGVLAAFIGSLLLVIAPNYLQLSVSVMIGLPCIGLALTSVIATIFWHKSKKLKWLIASAIFIGLSISTKLFTLFLVPIILLGIAVDSFSNPKFTRWQQKLLPVVWWCLVFTICTSILFTLLVGLENLPLLINNHSDARSIIVFQNISLEDALRANYRVFLFGLSGLAMFFIYKQKQWFMLYFLAWFLTVFYLLMEHRPVWYHHSVLVYLPAIFLVSYALQEVILRFIKLVNNGNNNLYRNQFIAFSIVVFICSTLMIGEHTRTTFKKANSWREKSINYERAISVEQQLFSQIDRKSPSTNWMITDSPIFAFRAGAIVPPSTAVVSRKQLETGKITEEQLLDIIKQYQPEQVFLRRFPWTKVVPYLKKNYELIQQEDSNRLYHLISNSANEP